MIIDTFLYFNEEELLLSRLEYLYDFVDIFIICESTHTFSGRVKHLHFASNRVKFAKYEKKIVYHCIDCFEFCANWMASLPHYLANYFTDINHAYSHKSNNIPLVKLSHAFQCEVYQRDSIVVPLLANSLINDQNYILINDVDEVPNIDKLDEAIDLLKTNHVINFEQHWFKYFANQLLDSFWYGTRMIRAASLKGKSIDLFRYHLEDKRLQPGPILQSAGWHCSHLGGYLKVLEKLTAYDYQGRRGKYFLKLRDKYFPNLLKNRLSLGLSPYLATDKHSTVLHSEPSEISAFHHILSLNSPSQFFK